MTEQKPEYLHDTDKQTIKAMDGEDAASQTARADEEKSPQEDPGSPGGTTGTGGTANEQDD